MHLAHPSMTYASPPSHRMPHGAGLSRTLRLSSDVLHQLCKPSLKGRVRQKCCRHWRISFWKGGHHQSPSMMPSDSLSTALWSTCSYSPQGKRTLSSHHRHIPCGVERDLFMLLLVLDPLLPSEAVSLTIRCSISIVTIGPCSTTLWTWPCRRERRISSALGSCNPCSLQRKDRLSRCWL